MAVQAARLAASSGTAARQRAALSRPAALASPLASRSSWAGLSAPSTASRSRICQRSLVSSHRAAERIGDAAERAGQGGQGRRVEPDLAIADVIVVRQQESRHGTGGGRPERDPARVPVTKSGDLGPQGQTAARSVVVDPDGDPMWSAAAMADDGVPDGGAARREGVHAGRAKPCPGPPAHVPTGRAAQAVQQVIQGGAAEPVASEVVIDPGQERRPAQPCDQLPQGGGAWQPNRTTVTEPNTSSPRVRSRST